jgi:endogenous inhibitor of DNA gyrase (YacG/DUF329 family)
MVGEAVIEPWDAAVYVCGYCKAEFVPTDSQRHNRRSKNSRVSYCAAKCRGAATSTRCRHPVPAGVDLATVKGGRGPVRGPCKKCGGYFRASSPGKLFCSFDCYAGSDQFQTMTRDNARRINEGRRAAAGAADPTSATVMVTCQHCGVVRARPFAQRARQFCNRRCRGGFYAARFDRWIANPESIALPQNYDEFLDRDELPCVIEGCGWSGIHLSQHCNHVHGVAADQLKEMLGFNHKTGLCGRAYSEYLAARPGMGAHLVPFGPGRPPPGGPRCAIRAEAREHSRKASALKANTVDPDKPPIPCRRCGTPVPQRVIGRALYCGLDCRAALYRDRNRAKQNEKKHPLTCSACGRAFVGTDDQKKRADAGRPVNCKRACWTKGTVGRFAPDPTAK